MREAREFDLSALGGRIRGQIIIIENGLLAVSIWSCQPGLVTRNLWANRPDGLLPRCSPFLRRRHRLLEFQPPLPATLGNRRVMSQDSVVRGSAAVAVGLTWTCGKR
jgi:hypothetical protein